MIWIFQDVALSFDGFLKQEFVMDWISRLRAQSRKLHEKAHRLPFFQALWRHQLPLESFVTQLRCLAVIHGAMEKFLAAHEFQEPFRTLMEGYRPKLPLLLQDLDLYRERWIANVLPAVEKALRIADRILVLSEEDNTALVGFFYTLEGSTQGGRIMEPHVQKTFSIPEGQGTAFFSCYGEHTQDRWQGFLYALAHAAMDASAQETVIKASGELFEALLEVYDKLFPFLEDQLGHHVVSLNPEAGQHPIPSDERELRASVAAAHRCWNAFPYFEMRYGDRGKRFAASDAAWLTTLCNLEVGALIDQVFWLADVLSVRGIPTWLLENQLRMLHEELMKARPEEMARYERLLLASDVLRSRRASAFSEEKMVAFGHELKERFFRGSNGPWKDLCLVLAAATADEVSGIQGSLEAVLSWLRSFVKDTDLDTDALKQLLETRARSHP